MIWESSYWKEPLLEVAKRVSRWKRIKNWSEERFVQVEKDVFISFYAIRKLLDSHKLSDATKDLSIEVYVHRSMGKPVTLQNWHHVEELYDLSKKTREIMKLRQLCNQIMHSYVFVPSHNEYEGLGGFLFCSDKIRNDRIYEINLNEMIRVLKIVGNDYPSSATYTYNAEKGDYDISCS